MNKIGIVGSGRIGSHLAEQFLNIDNISEIQLANRNTDRLNGRILSLRLRAHAIKSKTKIEPLNWDNINNLDIIVICIKDNYDPRKALLQNELPDWLPHNLRYVGLLKDLPLLKLISNKLIDFKGLIAVITNPVEITTYFLKKFLPNSHVYGLGGCVDSSRLTFLINRDYNMDIPWQNCPLIGEHGNELLSIKNIWSNDSRLRGFSYRAIDLLITETKSIGFEIVKNLGFSLQDCVPIFAENINWLLNDNINKDYVSLAVPSTNTCISKPIIVTKNNIVEFSNFTDSEISFIESIEARLSSLINIIQEQYCL